MRNSLDSNCISIYWYNHQKYFLPLRFSASRKKNQVCLKYLKIFQTFLGRSVCIDLPSFILFYSFMHIWASPKPVILFFMLFRKGPGIIGKEQYSVHSLCALVVSAFATAKLIRPIVKESFILWQSVPASKDKNTCQMCRKKNFKRMNKILFH